MPAKTLSSVRALAGNARAYRSAGVRDNDGLVPRVDAVEVLAVIDWLKSDVLAVATLSVKEARHLALELLEAAERVEARV